MFLTHAGPEIGVASTKAFTTQLVSLSFIAGCHRESTTKRSKPNKNNKL